MRLILPEVLFVAGLIAYIVIRGVYESRGKNASQVTQSVDAGDGVLIPIMAIGGIALPVIYLVTDLISFADYRLPAVVTWSGVVVMMVALLLFWRSHVDLGTNWSRTLELRESHELITRGVYGRIRHPMYAAIWLFSLAQGLILQNWLAGWGAFVSFGLMYISRVGKEETMMQARFGKRYSDYASKTGRVFPRFIR